MATLLTTPSIWVCMPSPIARFGSKPGSDPLPSAGAQRYANELNLPGLRFQALRRFPYLVFNVERSDRIDVWRVLHGQRDIPVWMCPPGEP